MALKNFLFTSESVTEGHPDKVADQISDGVLDAMIAQDKNARVACETLVTTGLVVVAGEITTACYVDIPTLVRHIILDIGYDKSTIGFDGGTCAVITTIDKQSPDIAQGVNGSGLYKEQGAGDQGLMFGYACNETDVLMPMSIHLAHELTRRLAYVRKNGILDFVLPDGKAQVTVQYRDGTPVRVDTALVSTQHKGEAAYEDIREGIIEEVIKKAIPAHLLDDETKYFVNPTGRFVVGGPMGDCGLTGRKTIVDTYGGMGRHGGGAFSGKDPTKVDRSASYMARHVAKNIVAAGLADRCEVQLSYAIGVAKPISVLVDTFGTEKVATERIEKMVVEKFDFRPRAMIEYLDLLRPIYKKTAAYGHFGRTDEDFTWESTKPAAELAELLK